jgi:hypothetical protein
METERKIMEKIVDLVEEKNQLVEQLESLRVMLVLLIFYYGLILCCLV